MTGWIEVAYTHTRTHSYATLPVSTLMDTSAGLEPEKSPGASLRGFVVVR
jgi:hypothetical protein